MKRRGPFLLENNMNTAVKPRHRVASWPRATLPIICPSCSSSLGVIDETAIENRYAWADAITQIDLSADDPDADARAVHGECPHCHSPLAAISVSYAGPAAPDAPPLPMPKLSLVLHGGAYSGWAMIETRAGATAVVEHLFEPRPARSLAAGIDFVREFLLSDMPRPGYDL